MQHRAVDGLRQDIEPRMPEDWVPMVNTGFPLPPRCFVPGIILFRVVLSNVYEYRMRSTLFVFVFPFVLVENTFENSVSFFNLLHL